MLKNTFSYIDRNYQNPISLADAAAQSSLSVTHFSRLFKQATGMTFKEYLNLYRVNMAQHALIDVYKRQPLESTPRSQSRKVVFPL